MINEIRSATLASALSLAAFWPPHAAALDGATQSAPSATAPSAGAARASGGVSNGFGNAKDNSATQHNAGKEAAAAGMPSMNVGKQSPVSVLQSRQAGRRETIDPLTAPDRTSLRELSQMYLFDTKLAGLATAISANTLVRGYAIKMLEDNLAALDTLRGIARRGGVTLPGGVESSQIAMLHALLLKSGPDFDKSYLDLAGPTLQQQEITQLQAVSTSAKSEEFKQYALKQTQLAMRHLQLADKMNASAQVASTALDAARMAGQSVSVGAPAGTASNRSDGNRGNAGGASIAGSTVHPQK